jgi:hypothetical protein
MLPVPARRFALDVLVAEAHGEFMNVTSAFDFVLAQATLMAGIHFC